MNVASHQYYVTASVGEIEFGRSSLKVLLPLFLCRRMESVVNKLRVTWIAEAEGYYNNANVYQNNQD